MNNSLKSAEHAYLPKLRTEILAGVTTFLTMSYIVVVNPSILATEGTQMPFSGVLTATVLLTVTMSLLMGLFAKLPFAVAPGMGLNAFFTFTLVLGKHIPWQTALGMVFWSGLLFMLLSFTPLRVTLTRSIPENLRLAVTAGIGLFLAFIGLKNSGFVVSHADTIVSSGGLNKVTIISFFTLIITALLLQRRNPFAFIIGIVVATLTAVLLGLTKIPTTFVSFPDFKSVLFQADLWSVFSLSAIPPILTLTVTDLFDSLATFVVVSKPLNLQEKKYEKALKRGLFVDAVSTFLAGLLGSSPGTVYLESLAGIEAGGRTGLTAITTALCFIPCLFIAPFMAIIPSFATGPVLILVGALMVRSADKLLTTKIEEVVPAFLTLILIPLTFSITQGILWGFVSHVILYFFAGRKKELSWPVYTIALLALLAEWVA